MKKIVYLYWLIPLVLLVFQIILTLNSFNQLRYEEVANSVRNPYWLTHRTVYGGASSNVGWDGFLTIVYSIFGFSLFAGKYIRVIFQLISLLSLAAILKKYLGEKLAVVPLITIGLSPTLTFYNTISSQYAIDLQYLPIVFFLLDSKIVFLRFLGWILAMIAWMAYPPFVMYLPSLLAFYLWKWKFRLKSLILSVAAFLSPLILAVIYIVNRQALFADPVKDSGIFRGGGGKFPPDGGAIDLNIKNLFSDLFGKGISYNFDLQLGEFSLIFPVLTLLAVLVFGVISYRKYSKWKFLILSIWAVFVFNFIIYTFFQDLTGMPGVRRATGMLAAFYIFFTLDWYFVLTKKINSVFKWVSIVVLLLLPIHHLIVYPVNLSHLSDPTILRDATGFFELVNTPEESFKTFVEKLQKEDVYLKCQMVTGGQTVNNCRYAEMYAALLGSCLWNHLSCHKIYGYDWNSEEYVLLENRLWDENIFEP